MIMSEKMKNRPALRFPGFEGEWSESTVNDLSKKITDGTHDTPKAVNEGIPYLTAIHVKNGFIDFDSCYYLPKEVHELIYRRCNPELDDLLMVNIGAGTATVAKVDVDFEFSLKNVALIKPNKVILDADFFFQVQSKNSARLRHQLSSGGAQPFLSLKQIGKLKLKRPTIKEQKKIAHFLTAVDDKIRQLSEKHRLLGQYKKGVMQQIFSQQIRFKDDKGQHYPDWEKAEFGLLAEKSKLKHNPIKDKTSYPCIELESLSSCTGVLLETFDSVNQKSIKNKFLKGEVLFGKLRPYLRKYLKAEFEGVCSSEIWVLNGKLVSNEYLYYLIQSEDFNNVANVSSGSKMPRSDWEFVGSFPFQYPKEEEQQKIAAFLSEIDKKIEQVNKQLEQARTFKKGLLQQMFV